MRGDVHGKPHPMKGKRVIINMLAGQRDSELQNHDVATVSDWFDRVTGKRWQASRGLDNAIATGYGRRRQTNPKALPLDDEVVVVVAPSGQMRAVHQSEITEWPSEVSG